MSLHENLLGLMGTAGLSMRAGNKSGYSEWETHRAVGKLSPG